jgi:ABC-type amino acid transport substrate-binding protein
MRHFSVVFTRLFVLVSLLGFLPAQAQEVRLGIARGEAVQDVAAGLLSEIYKRAGIRLVIEPFPPARLTDMVLANEIDGEVARIGPYFDRNPSLFKVEPSYYHLVTTAFARADKKFSLQSPADLKGRRVGIIRGVYHAVQATAGIPDVVVVDTVVQLFKMLADDRIDVAVDVSINGADVVKQLNLEQIKSAGDIARREFYIVLIPSKQQLAPRLSRVITSMKESGELASLTRQLEQARLAPEGSAKPGVTLRRF